MAKVISVGELAKRVGLCSTTLRSYEGMGLLQAVQRNKFERRFYPESEVRRLKFIQTLKGLGVSLDQAKEIVDHLLTEEDSSHAQFHTLLTKMKVLDTLEAKLIELATLKAELLKRLGEPYSLMQV